MSMKRKKKSRQETLWIPHDAVASSPGHPFYEELERVLREEEFDSFVESKCSPYYAKKQGRPSIPPGVYFRMLLIGYFERIDSERGICWRCSDSLSLRQFLGLGMEERTPDHSSLSRIRNRLPLEVHESVIGEAWPHLQQVCRLERQRVVKGKKQVDVSYAISSLPATDADARRLLSLSRGHWGIENRLHWVRDVTFDEDRSQVRTGAAPQVLAGLRNLVISLVRRAGHSNVAAALRRHNAHLSRYGTPAPAP